MSGGFAVVLKNILTMTQQATTKAIGIVGDDLAINVKQMLGTDAKRENKIILAVARGSLINKAFLTTGALALSFAFPPAIVPLMALGGAYLCHDGIHKILHGEDEKAEELTDEQKIKKAIKTDTILSSEITIVALTMVAAAPILMQAAALATVGVLMTVGVYGVVGSILKLDDIGLALAKREGTRMLDKAARVFGRGLLKGVNPFIKTVGVVGTAAMFVVGGGMVMKALPVLEVLATHAFGALAAIPVVHSALGIITEMAVGAATGFAALPVVKYATGPLFKRAKTFAGRLRAERSIKKLLGQKRQRPPSSDAAPSGLKNISDLTSQMNNAVVKKPVQKPANSNKSSAPTKAQRPPAA